MKAKQLPMIRVDRMRVWNDQPDCIALTEVRAPEGLIWLVRIVGTVDHPMPKANRPKRRKR